MSYTVPIEFTITNPLFADNEAQKIQLALKDASELPWLETSFGRVRVGKEMKDGSLITYPETQQTFGTDYINVFPNDNVLAQSYVLIQNDEVTGQAENQNIVNWSADCSIIFFIRDLNEIDTSRGSNIEDLLRADIQFVIKRDVPKFTVTGWQDELEDVYAEFSADSLNPATKTDHKRYAYLRLNGTITYKTPCYSEFDYDGNFDFDPLQAYDFIYGGENFLQQS